MFKTQVAVISAAVLMFSACGSSSEEVDTTNPGSDAPATAGACIEGVVDCDDTAVIDDAEDPGSPDTDTTGGVVLNGAVPLEGGLTVDEALTSDLTGILAVSGNLFDDGNGLRLCSVLAESFPPQCGGASLPVDGVDVDRISELTDDELVGVEQSGGVTWTDGQVTLFGEVVDGTLVVDQFVAG
jgi:hypothetical protein